MGRRKLSWWRRAITAALSWSASIVGGTASGYNALDPTRKLIEALKAQSKQTANEVLSQGLRGLQAHCRHLERNNPTARAIIEGLTALVVCSGIRLKPDTGDAELDKTIDADFRDWLCHACVDGRSFFELQDDGFREVVAVGEGLWMDQVDPMLARAGEIPLRILPLESEWIADDVSVPNATENITIADGMELDSLGRPVAYLLQNPMNRIGYSDVKRVPASRVCHFFEKRRALQSRGEPWMAPIVEQLILERKLVDAEVYAAEQTASFAVAITSEYHDDLDDGSGSDSEVGSATTDDPVQKLRLGSVARLFPGEKVETISHTRPSQQIAPFRQMLRGDIAAAMRVPVRFLDRDVSRANYSSMRADLLDTQRLLTPVRQWYGAATIGRYYQKVLPWILLRHGITRQVSSAYRLLPDETPYVDPEKDVRAALIAIHSGLSTYTEECAKRGRDRDSLWQERLAEQKELESLGLTLLLPNQVAGSPTPPKPEDVTNAPQP